ncbi:protein-L-isoaspartate O-methyltransferase, partial [Myxococcota bacterium]|nr:protein-L-isoaspartate O-methyltransferase [Myxococcota bacterium]
VLSIERIPALAARAELVLCEMGCDRVQVRVGDGTQGAGDRAPFDRIVVTAGGPELPLPLLSQLSVGGILVGPFGRRGQQELLRIQRAGAKKFTREVLGACRFVDLIGEAGWSAPSL